jgi:hypothetical protein
MRINSILLSGLLASQNIADFPSHIRKHLSDVGQEGCGDSCIHTDRSAMPDPPGDGAWQSVACTVEAVTDIFMDSRTSWREVGADKAWEDLVTAWKKRDVEKWEAYDFSTFASSFFRAGVHIKCGSLGIDGSCRGFYRYRNFDGIDGTGPAAFFILNALVKIHQWISNNHYAVGSVSLRAENFATAFAYKDPHEDQFMQFMIANVLTVGFTMDLAPTFNKSLCLWISSLHKERQN